MIEVLYIDNGNMISCIIYDYEHHSKFELRDMYNGNQDLYLIGKKYDKDSIEDSKVIIFINKDNDEIYNIFVQLYNKMKTSKKDDTVVIESDDDPYIEANKFIIAAYPTHFELQFVYLPNISRHPAIRVSRSGSKNPLNSSQLSWLRDQLKQISNSNVTLAACESKCKVR